MRVLHVLEHIEQGKQLEQLKQHVHRNVLDHGHEHVLDVLDMVLHALDVVRSNVDIVVVVVDASNVEVLYLVLIPSFSRCR